jgi:hypothetical protein
MTEQDAQLLQVLIRQIGKNAEIDPVLAECRLILFEAKAPQPFSEVHVALHSAVT